MSRGFLLTSPPVFLRERYLGRKSDRSDGGPTENVYRYSVCLLYDGNPIPPELGGVVFFAANTDALTDAQILERAWEGVPTPHTYTEPEEE